MQKRIQKIRQELESHGWERNVNVLAPHNVDNILDPIWVNSRGAIPRFDRGSIEIRIMDVQECPPADLAIQTLVIETIRALTKEKFINLEEQMRQRTELLSGILDETSKSGADAEILTTEYPAAFELEAPCTAGQLWQHIFNRLTHSGTTTLREWDEEIKVVLREGPLAARMLRSMSGDFSHESVARTYRKLADCLAQNKLFLS